MEVCPVKNIIEEMYNGDLFPIGKLNHTDTEYRNAVNDLVATESALLKTYPEIKEMFEKYQDAQIQIISLSSRQEFVNGFRVGAQMALEMIKPIE